jgi:hypothetical protein
MAERPIETVRVDRSPDDDSQAHVDRVVRAATLARRDGHGLGARLSRRVVDEVVDEVVPFAELGSLTDRARLREQVMTRLADAGQRRGRGWSL